MLNLLKSFLSHPIIVSIRNTGSKIIQPVASVWRSITAPIRRLFAPLTDWWLHQTAPLRARWAAFRQRNPILGGVTAWTLTFFKWGVYLVFGLVFAVFLGVFGALPDQEDLRNIETSNATEIYTADSVLIGKYYRENRTTIKLENISPYVITALLATEDKRFFEHSGIDLLSWLRAIQGVATRSDGSGGGSTLSQQLAKNLYKRPKYWIPGMGTIVGKIKENIISIRLEKVYDKEQILNLYLNTVSFGGDRYGINVASKYFYNKKAQDLTPDQAAVLVGMLKASTGLDPTRNPKPAKERRDLVMRRMVQNQNFDFDPKKFPIVAGMVKKGALTQKEYEELVKKGINAKKYGGDGNNEGLGTYFREYLRTDVMPDILKNLKKEDGSDYSLYRDGLKIYTTLHSKMQTYAEDAVKDKMADLQKRFDQHWKNYKNEKPWKDDELILRQIRRSERYEALKDAGKKEADILANFNEPVKMTIFSWKGGGTEADTLMSPIDSVRYYFCMLNCGFMAMDHHNGYVRAWVGGTNFRYFKFNHITAERQVGSTFKPIVYAAALQDSMRPCQYFQNKQVTIEDWSPKNADNSYGGWCSMIGGLTYSVNVIAAQLIEKVGIQKTLDLSKAMGITSPLKREFGISLGAAEVSLYDMIKVYGTIANKGTRPEPVLVLKISDRNGKTIYDYKKELLANSALGPHIQALTPEQAETMTRMMQSVVDYGTARKLRYGYGIQGDFAGKTGTTQEQADGWFITFNPTLVTGAWVGGPSNAVRFRSMELGQGSAMALPIVATFWHKVANDRKLMHLLNQKFEISPEVQSKCGCPFRISISPDTLNMLMQDSTIRDSMRANGYKNLKELVRDRFGQPIPDEPQGGGEIDPDKYPDEQPEGGGNQKEEKKRPIIDRLFGRDKPAPEKEKKKGGG